MRPWAGYVRVSFVGGRSGDSFRSVEDQNDEIRKWAAREGREVIILEPELDGKSNDPNRVILNQAVQGVRDGRYEGVVTAYLSRAARDLRLTLDLWHDVEEAGGLVACATVNIDSSTIEGRLTRNILASVDQAQREQLAASFERQTASATERGIWQRRQTPTGYRKDPETRRLIPDEDAVKVRRAFRDRAAGRPITEIAADLGLTPSGARHLLRNRVYLGELRVRSYVNENAHPALISLEDFEAAQRARVTRAARSEQPPALLAGLVRCAGCGHVMSRNAGGGGRVVYGCSIHKSAGRCPEPASITVARLDQFMGPLVVNELVAVAAEASEDTGALDAARAGLLAAQQDLARFLEVTGSAGLDADTLAVGVQQRQRAIRDADDLVSDLTARQRVPVVSDPQALWDSLDVGERAQLLRGLVEAVVVRKVGRGGPLTLVADRVRVVRLGAGLFSAKAGSERALALRGVWPAADDPRVVRVPGVEDAF